MASFEDLYMWACNDPTYDHDTEPGLIRALHLNLAGELADLAKTDPSRGAVYEAVMSSEYWHRFSRWLRLELRCCSLCQSQDELQVHHVDYKWIDGWRGRRYSDGPGE